MTSLKQLPIDQYQRYRLVADVAGRLRRGGRTLRVLDIGGRTGLLRRFLPEDEVIAVDREGIEAPRNLVLGDGAALPFADRSFDLVCGFDTLEHVPPTDRDGFVDECLRVSGAHVALIGPWAGSRVAGAERELRSFLLEKLKLEHRYLEEHHEHGLPSRRRVTARMEAAGAEVVALGQGNLQRWLALMCLEIYLEADPDLRPFAPGLYEFYNAALYASDNRPPVYRHLLLAAVDGARLPDLDGIFEAEQEAPELFEALNRFLPDLLAFDRAKGDWQVERARFEATVGELREELEAHRDLKVTQDSELADLGGELEKVARLRSEELDQRDVVAAHVEELETELRRMSDSAVELEANRRATQAELDAVLADRERIRSTLEGVSEERDSVRAELAAVEADRTAVAEHRDEIQAARDQLTIERDRGVQERDAARAERDRVVDERNRVVGEHEAAAVRFGTEVAAIDRDREALRARATELELALTAERERLATLDSQRLAAVEAQLSALRAEHSALRTERDLLAEALGAADRDRAEQRARVAALVRALDRERDQRRGSRRATAALGDALAVEFDGRPPAALQAGLAAALGSNGVHAADGGPDLGPGGVRQNRARGRRRAAQRSRRRRRR